MCGIVGFAGARQAVPVILNGLYTLEYRGYDSAGIAVVQDGKLKVIKNSGRIKGLEERLEKEPISAFTGIGHTRWATHGEPTENNAHPHYSFDGKVAIVHNGIIENYLELREYLRGRGIEIRTDTDSEVVAHLFALFYEDDMILALRKTVEMLRGAYALGIICTDRPDEIVCTRHDNPLILGVGKGENMIASDIPAIMAVTRDYILLDDGDMARITRDTIELFGKDGSEKKPVISHVEWDISAAEKGGYPHFMIKEIYEQPDAVRNTISPRIKGGMPDLSAEGVTPELFKNVRSIHVTACGSALHAGLVGKNAIEKLARIPVTATVASEFRYMDPIIGPEDICIVISQSGETADTLAAMREAKARGAMTIAIVNVVGSAAAREADHVIYTHAGPEIAVATTKAYSAQLSVMYLIAAVAALGRGTHDEQWVKDFCADVMKLPSQIAALLPLDEQMKELSKEYCTSDHLFYIGRGVDHALATEASLKLKEISYVHSEAYAGGELKHGTISLIENGTPVFSLACDPALYEKTVSNIKSVKARGASVVLLTSGDYTADGEVCDHIIKIPAVRPELSPSLSIVPLQLLAYHIGVARGCDIDKPRNLAKSVTVE